MSTSAIATIIAAIIVIAVLAYRGWTMYGKRIRRASFGPEYDRVRQEKGSNRAADQEVLRRQKAHNKLTPVPLGPNEVQYYRTSWDHVQAGFLDSPAIALSGAEQLIGNLLGARGYPTDDRDERVALLSVEHAKTVTAYRDAVQLTERVRDNAAAVSTEDMRNALMQYRQVFDELLTDAATGTDTDAPATSELDQEREPST